MDTDAGDYEHWGVDELKQVLEQNSFSVSVVTTLLDERITGKHLKQLTDKRFKELGLRLGDWLDFNSLLEKLDREKALNKAAFLGNPKIFNDPIHGNIYLNPVCLAIIDTPQFQRLRYLKQLGLVYYVYPGAAHNRFEHSLGVCYLAGQYVRALKDNQEYLGITEQDILCVEIAALCHDLGHGPFSHTFDQMFIRFTSPQRQWTHENASKDMFDYLVKENGLDKKDGVFDKHGLREIDMVFIKELIAPQVSPTRGEWLHRGRPKEKAYLYEIVANKRNNIDVDKFDYMARDCHQLGIRNNFDHMRFIKFVRVISVDDELQICLRDKEVLNLYNLFSTRYTLHKIAYQHQVASAMSLMVAHAMIKANKHVLITGSHGKKFTISECIDDMAAYSQLTDNIIFKILDIESEDSDMKVAKELIQRLLNRDLYKCVYQSRPMDPKCMKNRTCTKIKQEIIKLSDNELVEDEVVVEIVHLDFGRDDKNPIESLNVYSKDNPDKGRRFPKEEASRIVAANYTEMLVRVYNCKMRDKSRDKKFNDNKSKEINALCRKWFKASFLDMIENED